MTLLTVGDAAAALENVKEIKMGFGNFITKILRRKKKLILLPPLYDFISNRLPVPPAYYATKK